MEAQWVASKTLDEELEDQDLSGSPRLRAKVIRMRRFVGNVRTQAGWIMQVTARTMAMGRVVKMDVVGGEEGLRGFDHGYVFLPHLPRLIRLVSLLLFAHRSLLSLLSR